MIDDAWLEEMMKTEGTQKQPLGSWPSPTRLGQQYRQTNGVLYRVKSLSPIIWEIVNVNEENDVSEETQTKFAREISFDLKNIHNEWSKSKTLAFSRKNQDSSLTVSFSGGRTETIPQICKEFYAIKGENIGKVFFEFAQLGISGNILKVKFVDCNGSTHSLPDSINVKSLEGIAEKDFNENARRFVEAVSKAEEIDFTINTLAKIVLNTFYTI